MGGLNVVRIGLLGKIQRHQRLEMVTSRHRFGNPGTIFLSLPPGADRRHEIRHDDSLGKVAARFAKHGLKNLAVAQVQVSIKGSAKNEG